MISSGSDNRKKKATRRQVLSLAGGATLALGTLGMMTFGAAATAYAQAPAATNTLSGNLTIGSPTTQPALPTLSMTNPNAGATNDQLSFSVTADATVTGSTSNSYYAAAELKLNTPFALSSTSYAEVYDSNTGALLGSTTFGTDQSALSSSVSTVDVYAASATANIQAGDPLEVIIGNVTNSTTIGSGAVSITLGTSTSAATPVFVSSPNVVTETTQKASTTGTVPTISLSPSNDPGQLTTLTYTFPVDHSIAPGSSFTVDLTSETVSGASYGNIPSADINAGGATLTVAGTNVSSDVTPSAPAAGTLAFTVGSTKLSSGVYSVSVPISGSGIESVAAQYIGTTGSPTTFVNSPSVAAWGYAIDLTSLTASNPYAGTKSDVTLKFKSNETTDVPLQVAGLGLSAGASGELVDATTGSPVGAVVFADSNMSSNVSLVAGNSYSLTLNNVTLPTASTAVTVDTLFAPSSTTALSLGSAATASMDVSASTTSPGASANWTLSGIETAATLSSGSSLYVSDTAGSYYPLSSGDYQIVDLSNSADTQTPSVNLTGGAPTLTLGTAIPSGNIIEITISGVVNATTSAVSTVSLTASGNYLEAAQVTAPSASSEMANGAIANASGALYEWAGGYAFHLPTVADAGKIEAFKSWPTQQKLPVPSTSIFASGDALTMGTLVQGVQNGTVLAPIYVVGSNGDLYHIASPTAFYGGGYSTKNIVEVPQSDLAMMTMASSGSTTPSAASVHSNGSFWQASGSTSIYEWVGGVAIHVASPSDLVSIAHSMGETVMASWPQVSASSVPASAMAPSVPVMGTVVKVLDGSSAGSMYVSTGAALVPISSAQLSSLGYPSSDVLEVSTTAGITVLS